MSDVIDTLAGIAPGSPLDAIRNQRLQARTHAQASHDSLFKPRTEADATTLEELEGGCPRGGVEGHAVMNQRRASGARVRRLWLMFQRPK